MDFIEFIQHILIFKWFVLYIFFKKSSLIEIFSKHIAILPKVISTWIMNAESWCHKVWKEGSMTRYHVLDYILAQLYVHML